MLFTYFIADSDYSSVIELLEFVPGDTEMTVTFKIREDKNVETKEYLELYLSAGDGVHLSPHPRAEVVIIDDDGASIAITCIYITVVPHLTVD